MTIEEVAESLTKWTNRHEALKAIIQALDNLEADDEEGREWVLEQLAEE